MFLVIVRCKRDTCEHNSPHMDTPGHVVSISESTLTAGRETASGWLHAWPDHYTVGLYGPQGEAISF